MDNLKFPRILAFFVIALYLFARVYVPSIDNFISPFIALPGLILIWGGGWLFVNEEMRAGITVTPC